MKQVGVLALQGAFIEHEKMLEQLGVSCIELRNKEDLEKPYDGIILPGGESTVQGKLLKELDMFDTIKKQIEAGMPVLATCAGRNRHGHGSRRIYRHTGKIPERRQSD